MGRIRELLDPMALASRLDAAFDHLDDPSAFRTLAELCARAGLGRLADAWRSVGNQLEGGPAGDPHHGGGPPGTPLSGPLSSLPLPRGPAGIAGRQHAVPERNTGVTPVSRPS